MAREVEATKSESIGDGSGCIMIFFALVVFAIGLDTFLRKVFELSEQYISKCG